MKTSKITKKVAVVGLILGLLGPALSQAQNQQYPLSKETQKRYQKITGKAYRQSATATPLKSQRRTDERYDTGPDYARPTHLVEMSLRLSPSLNVNTAAGQGAYQGFRPNGAGARFSVGPSIDYFFFKDRYALSSGLWYTIIRSGYQIPGAFGQEKWNPGAPSQESVYNLQYVQLPVTVKMFANNLFARTRLYVQTGGIINVKVGEHALDQVRNALYQYAESSGARRRYSFGDLGLLLGVGAQYKLNDVNAINFGISYQRGLLNVARGSDLVSKNRVVSLDLGFKF